jgi:polysaccharide export outer membrane protein
MIARVLTSLAATLVLVSPAPAQQPSAPATPRETVAGTASAPVATPSKPAPSSALPAAAAPAAARVEPVAVDPKDYRIGPEDVLDINVWKNPELSRERVPVRPDGKISHPLINDINVSGLTTNQVKAELTQRLSNFIENPEVSVVVREIHSPKVSVGGNVRMPGLFELKTPDVTVLDIINRAQGLNEFANKGNIKVIRRGQQGAIDFKYNDAVNGRNGANFIVQPGDVIVVN